MNKTLILKTIICIIFFLSGYFYSHAQPRPTKAQLNWHNQEFYLFAHFGPNTFTGKEWGHGDEPEDIFNPTNLDCRQWCRIAKNAGAKAIIITAKHHDGFCLWPSAYSKHTVRESKWKNGKGDVLKELSKACKEYGLKFGVYISPWDRNHPLYGTQEYNDVFVNMMKEIFTNYGPVWELWWDGANGEGPNGKRQVYDWHRYRETVKKLSPQTVIFSDVGPHIRWVGNEQGIAGTTNWNTLDTAGYTAGAGAPSQDTLTTGNYNGAAWIPAECDVSIRPGWFYHEEENAKVKTPEQLFELYLKSVGRGANLLLNVPPDTRGLFRPEDSAALMGFKQLRDERTRIPLYIIARPGNRYTTGISQNFSTGVSVFANCIQLREQIKNGQHISAVRVELFENDKRVSLINATTVGRNRMLFFEPVRFNRIVVTVTGATATQTGLTGIEVFHIPGIPAGF